MIERRFLVTAATCFLSAALLAGLGCTALRQSADGPSAGDEAVRLLALGAAGPNAEGAGDAVVAVLDADRPILRVQAAAILGAWAGSGEPNVVLPALEHADPLVRSLAQEAYIDNNAAGLGPIVVNGRVLEVAPDLLRALAELYDTKGFTDPAVLLPAHRKTLRDGLEGDAATAVLAADLLARIGDAGARRVLTELARTSDGLVQAQIARASVRDAMGLGPMILPQAFEGNGVARLGVMRTLVARPDPRLRDLMVRAMMHDPDLAVRRNAIRAIGNLGAAAPINALADVLANGSPEEKHDTLQALGACGGTAVAVLRRYIADGKPTEELEVEAIRALAPHATRDDISWIAARLEAPGKHVRPAAATALGEIAHPAAQEHLMLAAGDAEPLVRASITCALGRIGTVYAAEFLLKALADPSPLVASMAAWGIGEAKYADGVPDLAKVARAADAPMTPSRRLGDIYGSPRLAAIGALGKIGTDEAKTVLAELLECGCPIMRMAAAQAIGADSHATPEIESALEKHLEDPSGLVRAAALLSLQAVGKTYPAGYFQGK